MSAIGGNPNHHLWNNHGTWWVHATVLRGVVQERIRQSLRTKDPVEARRLRDEFLAELAGSVDLRLSLRIGRPRPPVTRETNERR